MLRFLSLILLLAVSVSGNGKSIVQLRDSVTGEHLPFANIVIIDNKKKRFVTDEKGYVTIPENLRHEPLESSYVGYTNKPFIIGEGDTIYIVRLSPTEHDLQEVLVKPKKEKYSKKNNPAVDFVKKIREDSKNYNPKKEPYYSYDKYEKSLIALNNFTGQFDSGFLAKHTNFLKNYVDTSNYTGARLLDLIFKEKFSSHIMSQDPKANKEIIQALRSEGIDEIVNEENTRVVLEDVIKEVDIYEGNINIMQNRFVSPLSTIGPDFYKYYLTDTVYIGSDECIELTFVPRNAQSMGFNGNIYVPVGDTTMFVKKITMRTPHDINLNFLQNLYINQSYMKDSLGNRHKTYDDVVVEMKLLPGTPEFYGRKTTVYDNFSYEKRKDFETHYHKLGDVINIEDSIGATPQFWDLKRMVPLTPAESRMGNLMADARKKPFLYWSEKVIRILENGYVGTGNPSKFDIGPINSLISYSPSQGIRFRIGGMTTSALNPHLFLKGYVAYATKTRGFKYSGTVEYSFVKKKRYASEWPRNGIYASYSYDQDLIGESYNFTNSYNFVLSLTRKSNHLFTNRRRAELGYVLELRNNFSVEAGFKYTQQIATRNIEFKRGNGQILPWYRQTIFNISLRWAKGEKFIQGRSYRRAINMDPWVLRLTHQFGPKGFLGSAYTTNITEFAVEKRFWFSAFGYMDVLAKAGKVWSSVFFPSLLWPNANLSYTIQPESYSLLDPMEFANDAYASIDMTYFGNGILFNRIPLIKKLKIREVVTFKGLMGTLSHKNMPSYNPELLVFPPDAHAMKMKTTPYMEIGAGIDNILSVLRVDYVWRLTYRNTPGVDHSGLRVSLHFTL
ncbi:MAG: carboxypeptidase-like regulatory domain-containing protein [Muribaculaceae bacterium]|nr:carboxypeptidase-like regulatory domain-containing protein [Muribaculaceae bacterium]